VDKKPKKEPREILVAIAVKLRECPEHGAHVTDIRMSSPMEVPYTAPGADDKIAAAATRSWGWSRSFDEGWERTFGRRDRN
jgi:hypothetical protein